MEIRPITVQIDPNPASGQAPRNVGGASVSPGTSVDSGRKGGPATSRTAVTATPDTEPTSGLPPRLRGIHVIDYRRFVAGPYLSCCLAAISEWK